MRLDQLEYGRRYKLSANVVNPRLDGRVTHDWRRMSFKAGLEVRAGAYLSDTGQPPHVVLEAPNSMADRVLASDPTFARFVAALEPLPWTADDMIYVACDGGSVETRRTIALHLLSRLVDVGAVALETVKQQAERIYKED